MDSASIVGLGTSDATVKLDSAWTKQLGSEFESVLGLTEVGLATELLKGEKRRNRLRNNRDGKNKRDGVIKM